ncbi:MAG TPA: WecB/TagA/CpsF family glycosyltransferase [Rhizomicrobium sp.]|jgi:exopolysaccharide biosynthesis WecB/TagA/CpsF family protein|nr:WecB/TagA/CpsF family glycosyltransferase [Rhizomicrobium sp.]
MTTQAMEKPYPEVMAGGLRIACIGRTELTRLMIHECLEARRSRSLTPKLVFGVNGQAISLAARNAELRRHHELADHVHADGQPLVLAARLFAKPRIPERSAVTDFFHDAAIAARQHGLRFFLLGASEENNAACARIMQTIYPGLIIAGRRHGYFTESDEADICAEINETRADIVWVGLGIPLEQAFCVRNRHRIHAGWMVGAGGCFNYVSGQYKRAPQWMQLTGFEWLHRLWREPRRLFWRYAVTNPHALLLLLTRTSSLESQHAALAVRKVRTAGSAG